VYLFLSALFITLAICVKWIGLWAGMGLAAIMLFRLIAIFKNKKEFFATIGICVAFFVIMPIGIYLADNNVYTKYQIDGGVTAWVGGNKINSQDIESRKNAVIETTNVFEVGKSLVDEIIFKDKEETPGDGFIDLQHSIYYYHSRLTEKHPFASPWFTWGLMLRPLFYFQENMSDGKTSVIALMGNPAVFWTSAVLFVGFFINTMSTVMVNMGSVIVNLFKKKKDKKYSFLPIKAEDAFIIIPILALMVPYIGITRPMFIYHYFSALPFMMLVIVKFMQFIEEKLKTNKIMISFCAVMLILFVYFYPIYSAMPVTKEYVKNTEWVPNMSTTVYNTPWLRNVDLFNNYVFYWDNPLPNQFDRWLEGWYYGA
jgi:dolichyl-phosphate-mannose--protein O-mannosyl transferase